MPDVSRFFFSFSPPLFPHRTNRLHLILSPFRCPRAYFSFRTRPPRYARLSTPEMAALPPVLCRDPLSYPINSQAVVPKASFGTLHVPIRRFGSSDRENFPVTGRSGLQKIGSWKLSKIGKTRFRFMDSVGSNPPSRLGPSKEPQGLTQEFMDIELKRVNQVDGGLDLFGEMKRRFLRFKKQQFLEYPEHFQYLAQLQKPKFMVIACADSRVCPSNILGFQPGESFTVRNVANLVPPFENGPTETNAALEFAVNSLEVGNILVIGHSCCGGIRALMSMQDDTDSSNSFIRDWVIVGKSAKLRTKAAASNLSFDEQCRHCEKESVNGSLMNLLTYPWIEKRVSEGILSLHGGYYDFVNCTFEKWTLEYKGRTQDGNMEHAIKDHSFWH